jgi:hypothetical protein
MGELAHRSKNALAVVQSMARQTASRTQADQLYVAALSARIAGLACTHDLVASGGWRGANLGELACHIAQFEIAAPRVEIGGPEIILTPAGAQNIGLALHELTANATVYGALSTASGQVSFTWDSQRHVPSEEWLHLLWREAGGPRVEPPSQRQVVQERELILRVDHNKPVRLGHLRCDFREVLGARHADGDRKAQFLAHAPPHLFCDFLWRTKEALTTGNLGKSFIDRQPLDEGRVVAENFDRGVAKALILIEVAAYEPQLRTEFTRPPSRHSAAHSERLRLVGCGEHNPAADGDGMATQGRIMQLLNRRVERIEVRM